MYCCTPDVAQVHHQLLVAAPWCADASGRMQCVKNIFILHFLMAAVLIGVIVARDSYEFIEQCLLNWINIFCKFSIYIILAFWPWKIYNFLKPLYFSRFLIKVIFLFTLNFFGSLWQVTGLVSDKAAVYLNFQFGSS